MKVMALFSLLLFCSAAPAWAEGSGAVEEWYLYPSFQYLTWSEFSRTGSRFVKESDPLYGAGGAVTFNLYERQLLLKVKAEVFGGSVGYRGETQSVSDPTLAGLPLKSDTVYVGGQIDVDVGWRMQLPAVSVEPFFGLGYRSWLRSLDGSTTFDRNGMPVAVGGYDEVWQVVTTKLGVRAAYPLTGDFGLFAEGGAKYPFIVRNKADFPGLGNVTLQPEGQWSGFAEVGCRYRKFRPSFFYEGYHAGQSPVNRGLLQPRTVSDIFGVNVGIDF